MLLHSTSSIAAIKSHLERVKCQALFTSLPLLSICSQVVQDVGISPKRVYLLDVPEQLQQGLSITSDIISVEQLVTEGSDLEPIDNVRWENGQGAKQVAYLCPTSGTSGTEVGCSTAKPVAQRPIHELAYRNSLK